jgi:UTP:GlnB (protein PII) uridylyltransferase
MDHGAQIPKLMQSTVSSFAPERVILFGSHARGEAGPDSDVDLLVIMPLAGKSRRQQTAAIYQQCHPGFPLDIVVRTPEEFEQGLQGRDWFLQEIAREGKVMYAA